MGRMRRTTKRMMFSAVEKLDFGVRQILAPWIKPWSSFSLLRVQPAQYERIGLALRNVSYL